MVSSDSYRPDDIITMYNGVTVEVTNTDAEGRLVLTDGLALAAEEEPDLIVDAATLTGGCLVALGEKIAGLWGNTDAGIERVKAAAAAAGVATARSSRFWRSATWSRRRTSRSSPAPP